MLISHPLEHDSMHLTEDIAFKAAKALGITLEQLKRRPTPRDLRGERMADLAQKAGQEAARRWQK